MVSRSAVWRITLLAPTNISSSFQTQQLEFQILAPFYLSLLALITHVQSPVATRWLDFHHAVSSLMERHTNNSEKILPSFWGFAQLPTASSASPSPSERGDTQVLERRPSPTPAKMALPRMGHSANRTDWEVLSFKFGWLNQLFSIWGFCFIHWLS